MFKEIVDEITHLATDGASDEQDEQLNSDCIKNISEFRIGQTSIAYVYLEQLVECKCSKQNTYSLTNASIGYELVIKLLGEVKPKSHWNLGIDDSIRLGLKMIKSGWLVLHGQHRFHIGQVSIVKNPSTLLMSSVSIDATLSTLVASLPVVISTTHHHASPSLEQPFVYPSDAKDTLEMSDDVASCYSSSPELVTPTTSPILSPLSRVTTNSVINNIPSLALGAYHGNTTDDVEMTNTSTTVDRPRTPCLEFKQVVNERLYVWVYENNGQENERKHYAWIYTSVTAPLISRLRRRLAKYSRLVLGIRRDKERKEYFKQIRNSDCKRTVPMEFYIGADIADGSSSYYGITECVETEQQVDLRIKASCSNVHGPIFWIKCDADETEIVQFCKRFYKAKDHVIDELYKDKMCLSSKSSFI